MEKARDESLHVQIATAIFHQQQQQQTRQYYVPLKAHDNGPLHIRLRRCPRSDPIFQLGTVRSVSLNHKPQDPPQTTQSVDEDDVDIVQRQCQVSREKAIQALQKHDNIVDAILELLA